MSKAQPGEMHNGGDAGGWGTGTSTGTGFAPNDPTIEEQDSGPLISQMAALDVTTVDIRLTVNGKEQPVIVADASTLKSALPKIKPGDTVSGSATIHLLNGTTRTAYLDETEATLNGELKFNVPYYYTCQKANGTIITAGEYISKDGINLSSYMEGGVAGWQCTQDGSMHGGSLVTGVRGDITLVPYYGEGVPVLAGYIKTDLNSITSYEIDETRTIDYAETSGIEGGSLGYLIVTPLPSGTLLTETQSGTAISWSSYDVSVTIDGTPLSTISFTSGDTMAVKIDNIPLGSSVSASAEMAVSGSSYTTLETETATGTVMAGGGLTMYAKFPVEYQIATAYASSGASFSATSGLYTSSGTTTLPTATASYIDPVTAITMRFAGWALNASDTTPVIVGDTIPDTYKGELKLYAIYSNIYVTLSATDYAATDTIVLSEFVTGGNTLCVTAEAGGFPTGATITYSWSIVPSSGAPITVTGSGASATVSTVSGASGHADVKVTASATVAGTAVTASASKTIYVAALSLPTSPVVLAKGDTTPLTASITGSPDPTISCSWELPPGANSIVDVSGSGGSISIEAVGGGKTTATAKANIGGKTLSKTIDIYVFDINLSGTGLNQPTTPGSNYSIVLTTNDTAGKSITASLNGSGLPAVTYEWTLGGSASSYIELAGSANNLRTLKPKSAGTAAFSVKAKYNGTVVSTATVDVTVAGIVLNCPAIIELGGATDPVTATVQGYSGSLTNWSWGSTTPGIVTIESPTNITNGQSVTVNTVSGGKTKITVSVDAGSSTLSAEKEVYVLNLNLTSADGSFTQPSLTEPNYKLTLEGGDTTGTTVTANLVGITDGFTYSWTPTSSTKMTAAFPNSRILSVKAKSDGTTGTESFTVRATSTTDDTIYLEKTVDVSVVDFVLKEAHGAAGATYPALTKIVLGKDGHHDQYVHVIPSDLQPGETDEVCTWSLAGGVVSGNEAWHRTGWGIDGIAGGQGTLTVSVNFGSKTITKEFDLYVLEPEITGTSPSGQALSADYDNPTILGGGDTRAMSMSVSLKNLDWSVLGDDLHVNWEVPASYQKALTLTPDPTNDRNCTVLAGNLPDGYYGSPIDLIAEVSYGEHDLSPAEDKRYVKLVGLCLEEGENYLLLEHSADADNQLEFYLEPVGVALSELGTISCTTDDSSIATAEATISGSYVKCKVTAAKSGGAFTYKTGVVTVTVSTTAGSGASAFPISYKKEIPVLDLVVKQGSKVIPDVVTIAKGATANLTAELKGVETGVDYTWDFASPSIISGSTTSGPNTTITTCASDYNDTYITVEADWSSDYDPVSLEMTWFVGFESTLDDFLSMSFASTTSAIPCTVKIDDVSSQEELQAIASAIGDSSDEHYKGVHINLDLSGSYISDDSIGDNTFAATGSNAGLATYLKGIVLPNGLTTIGKNAFKGCTALSSVEIPASCDCIYQCAFAGTSITLTDGAPSRTWVRCLEGSGAVTGSNAWSGTLDSALNVINTPASGADIYVYRPAP